MKTSRQLWLIEGPDGAGKTTLARQLAEETGAHYVHLGPFPRVRYGLARLYVDAMMPAVLGLADVVMDRCWLSERPYARVYRQGVDRLGPATRALERLAWRCQTLVVRCLPPWERVKANGASDEELYTIYHAMQTSLPMLTVDPFTRPAHTSVKVLHQYPGASVPHDLAVPSAGNLRGRVTLVGEAFPPVADRDPLYQWPFGSFCRDGYSMWLGEQLDAADISERDLFWISADALTPAIKDHRAPIVALGSEATRRLAECGRLPEHIVEYPQFWKRFHHNETYPLIDVLRGLTDARP